MNKLDDSDKGCTSIPEKFCGCQVQAAGEALGTYTCTANLDSGLAPNCRYEESQIFLDSSVKADGTRSYKFRIQNEKFENPHCDGICRDFEILPRVRNKVFSNIAKSLDLSL